MKQEYTFKYGEGYLTLNLEPENVLQELQAQEISCVEDVEKEVQKLLDHPMGTLPFNALFNARDKVTIVVSDITRLVKLHEFLPFIVKRLNELGIPDQDILILVATGTHRGQTPEEHKKIVGEALYHRIKVVDHDCDHSDMVNVGTTPRGTEVVVNKLVVERKVILTGGIVHHLMAGFGGGRKSILPGVSSRKTIAQNHLHSLDPNAERSNPLIGVGALEGNPLHQDMVDAAQLVNPDFLVNAIIHTNGKIARLVGGHWLTAWEEGCHWADEKFGVPIDKQADLVIASCGGFPKDISLYQGTKTLFNAALAVKPGGTILMLAECRDGAGADEFFGWSDPLLKGTLDPDLRKNFTIPGYIFYAAVESARKAKVILYSTIAPELVEPMGILGVNSLEEALKSAGVDKEQQDIILMPYGGATIPLWKGLLVPQPSC
ncbi:nickel-dependent lactate racemase [Desulfitobacterium sp.]|uniref:nickel-dependent lactate racemase n=1 Tax=Desulfitobacterium sp. TaxID=49981 RepID=UPI002BA72F7F|nr:nickel-dependent lactate racemase [Desulfitobacterium sp.]HVJ49937.1 nickel-dependent lactate racemase [Desulfitobacterium sp.]